MGSKVWLACGALAAVLACAPGERAAPLARIDSGALEGVRTGGVTAFLGVPYAAAPTRARRWRAPAPAPRWAGVRAADRFGAACAQTLTPDGFGPWTPEYMTPGPVSEDCLFLNVWTPSASAHNLPVLVWIHGGGFMSGSGAVPIYDGASLAREGVVVVTINYRLGVLGFLAHPELTAEADGEPPANWGLLDIVAALRWVRVNIAAFGGDPDAVTVAGGSAGAIAIHDLAVSPYARGLFRRAIGQSGLPSTLPAPTLAEAERAGLAFQASKGAASLAELRNMPADSLIGGEQPRFMPVIDGAVLPADPVVLAAEGANRIDMIVGLTADENSAFSPHYDAQTEEAFNALLEDAFSAEAARFAAFYPASSDAERLTAARAILRDRGAAALHDWARRRTHGGAYLYRFDHVEPGTDATRWGAFHGSEAPYVFATLGAAPHRRFSEGDHDVSDLIGAYWLNFIKTGDPNGRGLPVWPRYDAQAPQLLAIAQPAEAAPLLPERKLSAFEELIEKGGRVTLF